MSSKEAKGGAIDLAAHQVRRSTFGAPCPATKREIIFTGISIVIFLACIAYTTNRLIVGT
jgi:hypothetical protein